MLVRSSHIRDLFSMVVLRVDGLKAYMGSSPPFYRLLALPYSISQGRLIIVAVCEADLCTLDCPLTTNG